MTRMLKAHEVAAIGGLSTQTVRLMARRGELECVRTSKHGVYRFPPDCLAQRAAREAAEARERAESIIPVPTKRSVQAHRRTR